MRSLGEILSLLTYVFVKRFYIQKKHKMQIRDFHSDIFVLLKSIKSKQATFTHKKRKMQISDFHSDIFICLKRRQKDSRLSFS